MERVASKNAGRREPTRAPGSNAEPRRRALKSRHGTAGIGRVIRVAAVVVASALAHGALLGAPQICAHLASHDAPAPIVLRRAGYAASVEPIVRRIGVTMDRAALIARARAARRTGRLALGEFLLDSSAIDAREQGVGFDRRRAGALFAARLGRRSA